MHTISLQTYATWKPPRAGVRADDVGAQRPEEACIPRDGGFRGGVHTQHATTQLKNQHERVCGPTTLERSDRRRLACPEMAVYEGEFRAKHFLRWRFKREVQCNASPEMTDYEEKFLGTQTTKQSCGIAI